MTGRGSSGCRPAPRQHPAAVRDDRNRREWRPPCFRALQQLPQVLSAARPVLLESGTPGIDLLAWDLLPCETIPAAEIHFAQLYHLLMSPPPPFEPTANRGTPLKRGGEHVPGQALPPRLLADAVGEALGAARIDWHIGAADAAADGTFGTGVAPHPQQADRFTHDALP